MPDVTKDGIQKILEYYPDVASPSHNSKASWTSEPRLLAFIGTLNSTNFVYSFDYISWIQDSGISLSDTSMLDEYDLDTMRKLMTAQIRIGRFAGGHIQHLLNCGYFAAFLNSLRRFV